MEELCSFGTMCMHFIRCRHTAVDEGTTEKHQAQVAVSHKRTWAVEAGMSGVMSTPVSTGYGALKEQPVAFKNSPKSVGYMHQTTRATMLTYEHSGRV